MYAGCSAGAMETTIPRNCSRYRSALANQVRWFVPSAEHERAEHERAEHERTEHERAEHERAEHAQA